MPSFLRADISVVSMVLHQTTEVRRRLQPAVVDTVVGHKVHLSDHDVRPDSCSCFPANPRGCGLQLENSLLQDPCHGAVKRTATPPAESGQGKVRWRRRRRRVWNCWEQKLGEPARGEGNEGTEARGPDCDRFGHTILTLATLAKRTMAKPTFLAKLTRRARST